MDEAKRQRILKEYGLDKPPPGQEAWWAFVEQADLGRLLRAMEKVPDPEQIRADTLRGAVRRVLKARGLPLSPKQDAYLDNYDDLEELGGWLDKAVTVASADEMFPWIERGPASSPTDSVAAKRMDVQPMVRRLIALDPVDVKEKRRQEIYKEYGIDKPPPGEEAWWAFVERADLDRLLKVIDKVNAPDEIREETRLSEARRALRSVIQVRGLALTPEQDEHIETCEELHELHDWLERTVTATSMKEVFRWFEDSPYLRR